MTTTKMKKTEQQLPKLQPNPFQHEILELVSKQRTKEKKIEVLREYRNDALVSILIWNFDDSIRSSLPEGPVPYSSVQDQTSGNDTLSNTIDKQLNNPQVIDSYSNGQRTSLRREAGIFYNFIEGGNNDISKIRRETMFINLLEGLHPLEAEILILTKDKQLASKYKISLPIISEAYPDIQWGGRS
ncbi:MAG: Synechococcus phage [Bacteroidota bacterium]|jgi:hypothetical protein